MKTSPLTQLTSSLLTEPAALCRFTDTVDLCVAVRVSALRSESEMLEALDNMDLAKEEIIRFRVDACYHLGEAKRQLRVSEKRVYQEGKAADSKLSMTEIERRYKTDDRHAALDALITQVEGVISACDQTLELLKDKTFRISLRLKR